MTIKNTYTNEYDETLTVDRNYETDRIAVAVTNGGTRTTITLPLAEWRELIAPIA